jgi:hypothetical protein
MRRFLGQCSDPQVGVLERRLEAKKRSLEECQQEVTRLLQERLDAEKRNALQEKEVQ